MNGTEKLQVIAAVQTRREKLPPSTINQRGQEISF
jgi:hypothetical protein